jgi:hypothetical protein
MSSDTNPVVTHDQLFSRYAYLLLAIAIQALAFGVFLATLTLLQWRALERWPFLATEFLVLVGVCFGQIAIARKLCWRFDMLDALLLFTIGLLECVPMLLLGTVPHDLLWWFICYLALTNVVFLSLTNARMKTAASVAMPLNRRRVILNVVHSYLLLLAIAAAYYDWQVNLVGVLFMIDQAAMLATVLFMDRHTVKAAPQRA